MRPSCTSRWKACPTSAGSAPIGSAGGFTLNEQGLLSGLMAMETGLAGKPMESVENACATGGQAILSVAHSSFKIMRPHW